MSLQQYPPGKKGARKHILKEVVIGGDIGGTHTRICLGAKTAKGEIVLLAMAEYPTQKIKSIIPMVKEAVVLAHQKFGFTVSKACIGVASANLQGNISKMTNAKLILDKKEICHKTGIHTLKIINDFDTIGYSINAIHADSQMFRMVQRGKPIAKAPKAVLGAGTGLGKSLVIWNKQDACYEPHHSEGGHADAPLQSGHENALAAFIKKKRKIKGDVSYEDILSGRGIGDIFDFLSSLGTYKKTASCKDIQRKSDNDKAAAISMQKKKDILCRDTFAVFANFYARCCRNYCLETCCFGGLYVAGGIAQKNQDMLVSSSFSKSFERLESIPVLFFFKIASFNFAILLKL